MLNTVPISSLAGGRRFWVRPWWWVTASVASPNCCKWPECTKSSWSSRLRRILCARELPRQGASAIRSLDYKRSEHIRVSFGLSSWRCRAILVHVVKKTDSLTWKYRMKVAAVWRPMSKEHERRICNRDKYRSITRPSDNPRLVYCKTLRPPPPL